MKEDVRPEIGKTYLIRHSRKGTFTGKILAQDDEFSKILIVDGEAKYLNDDNGKPGETISIRRSFCTFSKTD